VVCFIDDDSSKHGASLNEIPIISLEHACYKYYVFVEPEALKSDWSRDRIMNELMAEGIPCGTGSCSEIYLEKAFGNSSSGFRVQS